MTARRTSKRPAKALSPARSERGDLSGSTLVHDLGAMIDAARKQVAVAANAALTTLYWQIGQRMRTEVLDEQRAKYGGQIVSAVGRQLEARYGRGFGEKSLRHMVRFALAFPDPEIVSALRRQFVVEPLQAAHLHRRRVEAHVLRRDVPHRGLVDANAGPGRLTACSSSAPRSPRSRRSSSARS